MDERGENDSIMLLKKMEKYDFIKPYEVSVSIIENECDGKNSINDISEKEERENSERIINESNKITSIYFATSHEKQNINNNTETCSTGISFKLPERNVNAETQNNFLTNANSVSEFMLSQKQTLNSHPSAVDDLSSNYREYNDNSNELNKLSKSIITILKAYNYYGHFYANCAQNEFQKKVCFEKYMDIKKRCIYACSDIIVKYILPQGKSFNVIDFLKNTLRIANDHEKLNYTYKNIETVYHEIMVLNYNNISSREVVPNCHAAKATNNESLVPQELHNDKHCNMLTPRIINGFNSTNGLIQTRQEHLHNDRYYSNITQTTNADRRSTLQKNVQNYQHSSNVPYTVANGSNPILQDHVQNDRYNSTIMQISNNGPNMILQQNAEIDRHSSNIAHTMANRPNSTLQKHVQNGRHYSNITQTNNNGSSIILQRNAEINRHSNNIAHTMANGPNPTLQEHVQNDGYYSNIKQTNNNQSNTILQQNAENDRHSINIPHIMHNGTNPTFQEPVQNDKYSSNIKQPNYNQSDTTLLRNAENDRYSSDIAKTIPNRPNSTLQHNPENNLQSSVLQALLQKNDDINKLKTNLNKRPNSTLEVYDKSDRQKIHNKRSRNKKPNSRCQQYLDHNIQKRNLSDQTLPQAPTTCVFQYKYSDYEVRVDVNTGILNNINQQNQFNNDLRINNPSYTKKPYTSDDVRKPVQSTERLNASASQMPIQNVLQTLQDPVRSTSRDSGIMSPSNNLISDLGNNGEVQDSTSPYITHVTSLNPGVTLIPSGPCHVCGKLTKNMCIGCYKYYYCGDECQKLHWSTHALECENRR